MLINEFQIHNYKSFRSTPSIVLSAGFNVFIGKNNAGKTALLEALSLPTLANKQHRHSGIPRGQPLSPQSVVDITFTLTPADLRQALLNAGPFWFPMPAEMNTSQYVPFLHEFVSQPRQLSVAVHQGLGIGSTVYPSHGMFSGAPTNYSAEFEPNDARNDFQANSVINQQQ